VTDAPATVRIVPAGDILALDLWDAADAPDRTGTRAIRVEPRRWWLFDPTTDATTPFATRGALAPIGGGLMRADLTGPGWRALLSVSGLFDVDHPDFGPGSVAATVIHHVPVWIVVIADDACEVYCAASYAPALTDLWRDTIGAANVVACQTPTPSRIT